MKINLLKFYFHLGIIKTRLLSFSATIVLLLSSFAAQTQCAGNFTFYTCDSNFVIAAPGTADHYNWFEYSNCSGFGGRTYVNTSNNYSNTLSNGSFCIAYDAVDSNNTIICSTNITVVVETDFHISTSSNNVNANLSLDLSGNKAYMGYSNFQWYRDGQAIQGATTSNYTATLPGAYYITAASTNCNSRTSDTIIINDACNSAYTGNLNLCQNPVTFSLSNSFNYDWYVAEENLGVFPNTYLSAYTYYKSGNNITLDKNDFSSNLASYYIYYIAQMGGNTLCSSSVFQLKINDLSPHINNVSGKLTHDLYVNAYQLGFSNYQWFNNGQSIPGANTLDYTPITSGNYYFTASSPFCGNTISDSFLNIIPNQQCDTIRQIYYTCDTVYTLTHQTSPGYSIYWFSCDSLGNNGIQLNNGVSNNSINVFVNRNSSFQSYHFFYVCIDIFTQSSCTSSVQTVVFYKNLPIVANSLTLPAVLSANPYISNMGYNSYQWYRNGRRIPNANGQTYDAILPGDYQLRANSSNCGASFSNSITFACSTSASTVISNYIFPSGTWNYSGDIYLSGDISIPHDALVRFSNARIFMSPCTKIIVDSADRIDTNQLGGRLIIDSCLMGSCDIWQGIHVIGQKYLGGRFNHQSGTLTMNNTALNDAAVGIYNELYSYLYVNKCKFENNYNHISIESCWEMDGYIDSSRFSYLLESNSAICYFPAFPVFSLFSTSNFRKHLFIHYSSQIRMLNDTFECFNLNGFQSEDAIEIHDIQSSQITASTYGMKISDCKIWGDFNYGIFAQEPHYLYIDGNGLSEITGDFTQAIHLTNFTHVNIDNQYIENTSGNTYPTGKGVYLKTGFDAKIQNCSLKQLERGVEFYDNNNSAPPPPETWIKNNLISQCIFGIATASNEFPVNAASGVNSFGNQRLLRMYCNQILNCDYGIVGSGPILDQGSASGGYNGNFQDWSNRFCDNFSNHNCQGGSSSTYADLVWWNPNTQFGDSNYFFIDTTMSFRELKQLVGTISIDSENITDSKNRNQYNIHIPSSNQSIDFYCVGGLINGKQNSKDLSILDLTQKFKIHPNPADNFVIIENQGSIENYFTIEISDNLGKYIFSTQSDEINSYISLSAIPQGFYNVRIINNLTNESSYLKLTIIR